jgi:hypothetical protein
VSAKRIEIVLSAAGLILFGFVVSKIGWYEALHQLRQVWLALPILVGLSLVRLLLQTRSWQLALREEGVQTEFRKLMGIRLASQSFGYLSILGPAAEPMKIKLLGNEWKRSATATLVDSECIGFVSSCRNCWMCCRSRDSSSGKIWRDSAIGNNAVCDYRSSAFWPEAGTFL